VNEKIDKTKNQHYVPQFFLRQFSNKQNQIYTLDKKSLKIFRSNVRNIASENYFYDFPIENKTYSLESSFHEIETESSKLIKKIIENESIKELNEKELIILSYFIVLQDFRTLKFRKNMAYNRKLFELFLSGKSIKKIDDIITDDDKKESLLFLDQVNQFAPLVYDKNWILIKYETGEFYLSDNPVVKQNTMFYRENRGNIGYNTPGVEIYLPIAPNFALGLFCKSINHKIQNVIQQNNKSPQNNPDIDLLQKQVDIFESEKFCIFADSNAENVNSLLVMFSESKLFSFSGNFDLAIDILKANKCYMSGSRINVE